MNLGESAYDRYYGDPTLDNPNLAPLDEAPYYAIPIYPGDIGTKGGLVIDEHRGGNVLKEAFSGLAKGLGEIVSVAVGVLEVEVRISVLGNADRKQMG